MEGYVRYYVSEDYPNGGTWSVYSELYADAGDHDPIDGSQQVVISAMPDSLAAEAAAKALHMEAHPHLIEENPFI